MAKKKALYNFKLQNPFAPEREGASVFYKDAKGRDEGRRGPYWVRRHDEYDR